MSPHFSHCFDMFLQPFPRRDHTIAVMSNKEPPKPASSTKAPAGDINNYSFLDASQVQLVDSAGFTSFKYKIDGVPRPEYRAATKNAKTGTHHFYTASKKLRASLQNAIDKAISAATATGKFDIANPSNKPVFITVKFYFARPKCQYTWIPSTRELILGRDAPFFCTAYPDVDNAVKLVLDAMQDRFYGNDKCVVVLKAYKLWLHSPGHVYVEGQNNTGATIFKVTQYKCNNSSLADYI